ncbi:LPS export ABC transporter periplasmic protein LptC [Aquifex pyrophilus]
MLKGFLLIIFFLSGVLFSELYVKEYLSLEEYNLVRSKVEDVHIKVFTGEGKVWDVRGKELLYERGVAIVKKSVIRGGGYTIKAERLYLNRRKKKGKLEGNVEIFGEDMYLRTRTAYVDFKENRAWGYDEIILRKEKNVIRGKGFKISFKPFKVIIDEVKSIHSYP